jgi:hydroxyacyl-ACP dehydratase HTD2-like protein with hotdog domain
MTTTTARKVYIEDVKEGMEIPSLEKVPSTQQLVQWAAGSGDFYQIHYDLEFARSTGLPGLIVHGALKHAFLGQMLWDWVAPSGGKIKRFGCSYRGMDYPGQKEVCRGIVKRVYQQDGEHLVDLEIWVENAEGQKTTPGSATVSLPSRGS